MDRGAIGKASHRKPVRPSRAKGTPCGKCTRSNALGDIAESERPLIFASCPTRTLLTSLAKRSPRRQHRRGTSVLGEHKIRWQATDARQIKAIGIRASARTRFNQSQPLATGSPLSSRSLRLSVHCVGICHPRRPGGPRPITLPRSQAVESQRIIVSRSQAAWVDLWSIRPQKTPATGIYPPCRSGHESKRLIYQKGGRGQLPGGIQVQVFGAGNMPWPAPIGHRDLISDRTGTMTGRTLRVSSCTMHFPRIARRKVTGQSRYGVSSYELPQSLPCERYAASRNPVGSSFAREVSIKECAMLRAITASCPPIADKTGQ